MTRQNFKIKIVQFGVDSHESSTNALFYWLTLTAELLCSSTLTACNFMLVDFDRLQFFILNTINNNVEYNWLNLSMNSFKIK